MKTVWKYAFPVISEFVLCMPKYSRILSVQTQNDSPVLWASLNTDEVLEDRNFILVGTGHPINKNNARYIGTFQLGNFVGHIFEWWNE